MLGRTNIALGGVTVRTYWGTLLSVRRLKDPKGEVSVPVIRTTAIVPT